MRCISHFHTMLYRHHCSFFLVKILPQVTKGNEEGKLIYQPICYGMIPDKFSLPKLKRRRREAAKCHEDIKEMLMSIWTNLWQIYDKFTRKSLCNAIYTSTKASKWWIAYYHSPQAFNELSIPSTATHHLHAKEIDNLLVMNPKMHKLLGKVFKERNDASLADTFGHHFRNNVKIYANQQTAEVLNQIQFNTKMWLQDRASKKEIDVNYKLLRHNNAASKIQARVRGQQGRKQANEVQKTNLFHLLRQLYFFIFND